MPTKTRKAPARTAIVNYALAHPDLTYAEIAAALGLSEDWVSRCCRGRVRRTIGRKPRPLPADVADAVADGIYRGDSHADIAGRLGRDRSAISKRLRDGRHDGDHKEAHEVDAKTRRHLQRRVDLARLLKTEPGIRSREIAGRLGVTQRHANRLLEDFKPRAAA